MLKGEEHRLSICSHLMQGLSGLPQNLRQASRSPALTLLFFTHLSVKGTLQQESISFTLLFKMDNKTCLAKLQSTNELETSLQHCDYFPPLNILYICMSFYESLLMYNAVNESHANIFVKDGIMSHSHSIHGHSCFSIS